MNRFDESVPSGDRIEGGEGTGYLIVRVGTARGAIPLENATVTVRMAASPDGERGEEGADLEGAAVASLRTDRDGLAPRLTLAAPPKALSESPGSPVRPYSLYDIEVFLDGYAPNYYQNVPVFDTVTSLQTVELIPIPAGERPELMQDPPSFFFRSVENAALEG